MSVALPKKQLYTTPIALFGFNRPHLIAQVFERIRKLGPQKLFFIMDGVRETHPNDKELCQQTQDVVVKNIDWDCEFFKNFSNTNLGCGKRISSGIDWVFKHVEEVIILEDDCLANMSFFRFYSEMLKKYRGMPEIMMVSGNNYLPQKWQLKSSYYFSRHVLAWGWATWKRAWNHFSLDIPNYPKELSKKSFKKYFLNSREKRYYKNCFDSILKGCNVWSYQWSYALLKHKGFCVCPGVNLVSNIGFGKDSTHTVGEAPAEFLKVNELLFPLNHPKKIKMNKKLDVYLFKYFLDLRGTSVKTYYEDFKLYIADILPIKFKKILKQYLLRKN